MHLHTYSYTCHMHMRRSAKGKLGLAVFLKEKSTCRQVGREPETLRSQDDCPEVKLKANIGNL